MMNGSGLPHDGHQRLLGHVGDDEQQQAEGRREQPDHDVDDHDDAEMHHIHAKRLGRRDQDWDDDQQDRRSLEQASEHQQYGVDEQQESRCGVSWNPPMKCLHRSGIFSMVTT